MKKLVRTMCMVGLVALVTVSCKKKEENNAVTLGLPQMEVESVDEDRAYIDFGDGNQFKWNENDQIVVYNLNYTDGTQSEKRVWTAAPGAEGTILTTFSGDAIGAKKDGYFYFYPATIASNSTALDVDNRETFTVADTQDYIVVNNGASIVCDNKALALACTVDQLSDNFTLQHIFGICRLKLTISNALANENHGKVTSVVLRDRVHNLTGSVSMKLHVVDDALFSAYQQDYIDAMGDVNAAGTLAQYLQDLGYHAEPIGKEITLDCSANGGVQLYTSQQSLFYIVVRPGALINGFYVDVNFEDGYTYTINKYQAPKASYCIKAGNIKGFAVQLGNE